MFRLAAVAVLAGTLILATGCYMAPVKPPVGGLYSDFKAPLTSEYVGQGADMKSGEAYSASVLGLFAWGDCSVESAAKQGQLSSVSYCDYHFYNVLGVYQKFTVIAHGK